MDNEILLKKIEQILIEESFDCSIEPVSADQEEPLLLVYLGTDKSERERILQMRSRVENFADDKHLALVNMILYLPFTLAAEFHYDLINVVTMINTLIELPGFELDLVEDKLRFRYVHAVSENELTNLVLKSLVGIISLTTDLFADVFEQVNAGKITFQDFLNGLEDLPEKNPSKSQ